MVKYTKRPYSGGKIYFQNFFILVIESYRCFNHRVKGVFCTELHRGLKNILKAAFETFVLFYSCGFFSPHPNHGPFRSGGPLHTERGFVQRTPMERGTNY
jgi:hypothetical protein